MQHILTDNTLTVVIEGIPRSLHRGACDDRTWIRAMDAVSDDDIDTLTSILDKPRGINRHFQDHGIEVRDGVLYFEDEPLEDYGARKAVQFVEQGLPAGALINFLKRVRNNPSYRAVQDLYKFLEHNGMPLTHEGCFMAYKKVRRVPVPREEIAVEAPSLAASPTMFVDIYTRKICNDPGETVSMRRNEVDENPQQTCSYGLHVCSYDYLPDFGTDAHDTVVMVEVDPADVVAIPGDYNNAKMRVCKYTVLREIPEWRNHSWDRGVVNRSDEVECNADVPLGCEGNDDSEHEGERPGDDLNGARQEHGRALQVQNLADNLSWEERSRLSDIVRGIANAQGVPSPLSTVMKINFMLERNYDLEQIKKVIDHG